MFPYFSTFLFFPTVCVTAYDCGQVFNIVVDAVWRIITLKLTTMSIVYRVHIALRNGGILQSAHVIASYITVFSWFPRIGGVYCVHATSVSFRFVCVPTYFTFLLLARPHLCFIFQPFESLCHKWWFRYTTNEFQWFLDSVGVSSSVSISNEFWYDFVYFGVSYRSYALRGMTPVLIHVTVMWSVCHELRLERVLWKNSVSFVLCSHFRFRRYLYSFIKFFCADFFFSVGLLLVTFKMLVGSLFFCEVYGSAVHNYVRSNRG